VGIKGVTILYLANSYVKVFYYVLQQLHLIKDKHWLVIHGLVIHFIKVDVSPESL
jgi:hypothetical protein